MLEIGYEESGDSGGFPIILLHGFPYDIRAWDGVVPALADAGYRVLVPYLRGLRADAVSRPRRAAPWPSRPPSPRTSSTSPTRWGSRQAALAGFDWGNRAACITSILHPERVRAQVAMGGYSVQDTVSPSLPSPSALAEARLSVPVVLQHRARPLPASRRTATPSSATCGRRGRRPGSTPTRRTNARRRRSTTPDFVDIVIHSYRHRQRLRPRGGTLPGRRAAVGRAGRRSACPPSCCAGADSGFGPPSPDPSGDQARFTNLVARRIVEGAGHDLAPQRPDAVSSALLELLA